MPSESASCDNAMDAPTGGRYTPFQNRYTAYLHSLSQHWAYEKRVPGRTQQERRMVEDGFKQIETTTKKKKAHQLTS